MSEIYLIRHAQASFGADDYDHLSPVGIRQAQIVADYLTSLNMDFDAIYSGRMKRQQDTASPLCRHYGSRRPACTRPAILPAFDEYDARALLSARTQVSKGAGELTSDDLSALRQDKKAFQAYFTQTVYGWVDGDYDGQKGVEPWPEFRARVSAGIEHLIHRHGRGRRIAVYTSGGPISVALQITLGLSHRKTVEISWQIMNASLTCIKYNPSGLALSFFNNTTPLLLADDPGLLTYR